MRGRPAIASRDSSPLQSPSHRPISRSYVHEETTSCRSKLKKGSCCVSVRFCRATGLCLSGDHRLLGEATRQGGKTVIINFLPPGFNGEYDARARLETK